MQISNLSPYPALSLPIPLSFSSYSSLSLPIPLSLSIIILLSPSPYPSLSPYPSTSIKFKGLYMGNIHYMTKSMWTPYSTTSYSKIMGINMEFVWFSTRCWNIAAGTCFHSVTRALVKSGTDVGRLGLARSRRSNSSQRCSMGLRSGLCASQSSSSTTISTNHFCMDLALCTGALQSQC